MMFAAPQNTDLQEWIEVYEKMKQDPTTDVSFINLLITAFFTFFVYLQILSVPFFCVKHYALTSEYKFYLH